MRILTSLTYYLPYLSGISIYAQRLAKALVERGHRVVVLTAQHQKGLKESEDQEGVKVVRVPVWFTLHKGVVMPGWLVQAWRFVGEAEVCFIHLPQPAGLLLSVMAKLQGKRAIGIHHCDVILPAGSFNRLVEWMVRILGWGTCFFLESIVAYTQDYAVSSPVLKHFQAKIVTILPPIEVSKSSSAHVHQLAKSINRQRGELVVGFAGRVAAEKGIEYLLEAVERLQAEGVRVKLAVAGPIREVVGEREYGNKIARLIRRQEEKIVFLGPLNQSELGAFYTNIDVLVLPSVNRTESFGLVQAEAMLCGVPVVASNLPGVRVPVRLTGMGKVVAPRDSRRLAAAIKEVGQMKNWSKKKAKAVFSATKTYDEYERLCKAAKPF